jgi:hypothetical protein
MQRLHVDGWLRGCLATAGTEHIGCPFLELRLPRCDLIGVDVELLRKLSLEKIRSLNTRKNSESSEESSQLLKSDEGMQVWEGVA